MVRQLTERDLGDESDQILEALDRGESFIVMRDGLPVGELLPFRPRQFVPVEILKAIFANLPPIDFQGFREDIDRYVDQDPTPRV